MSVRDKLIALDHNVPFNYYITERLLMIFYNLAETIPVMYDYVDEYGNTIMDFIDSDNNFAFLSFKSYFTFNSFYLNKQSFV